MSHVSLVATRAFTYGGRALKPGDAFTAPRVDARVLKGIKKAVDANVTASGTYRTKQEPEPLVGTLHEPARQAEPEPPQDEPFVGGVPYEGTGRIDTGGTVTPVPTTKRQRTSRRSASTYRRRDLVPEPDADPSE